MLRFGRRLDQGMSLIRKESDERKANRKWGLVCKRSKRVGHCLLFASVGHVGDYPSNVHHIRPQPVRNFDLPNALVS